MCERGLILYPNTFKEVLDWSGWELLELWGALSAYAEGREVKIGSRVVEQQWRHMKAKFDSDAEK